MQYNFSTILNCKEITTECSFLRELKDKKIHEAYQQILQTFCLPFHKDTLLKLFQQLVRYKIELNIPYTIIDTHINDLRDFLVSKISLDAPSTEIIQLLNLFKEIKNSVAHHYLFKYIDDLIIHNQSRKSSLKNLLKNDLTIYYEAHLIWLTNLAKAIKENTASDFPELNHNICTFGKWLNSNAKLIVDNEAQYNYIYASHKNLHLFAQKIFDILGKGKYRQLITYLEKCELISLNLGVELSILDNTIISGKIDRDSLTQVLNRNALGSIFKNQYELSLGTRSSFVIAMCDLDLFKNINDTYGHLAGDAVLQSFVECIKENSRNSDIIIRFGGEEFLIILPSLSKDDGYMVLDNIRQKFEESTLYFEGKYIKSTVSIGMVCISPLDCCTQELKDKYISLADAQLYRAKRSGRNKVKSA